MLKYIKSREMIDDILTDSSVYDDHKAWLIGIVEALVCRTGGDYISLLAYNLICKYMEGEEFDSDRPERFWNVVSNKDIREFLSVYKEELDYYLERILHTDYYYPDLPDYDVLLKGVEGFEEYYFYDIVPRICMWILAK